MPEFTPPLNLVIVTCLGASAALILAAAAVKARRALTGLRRQYEKVRADLDTAQTENTRLGMEISRLHEAMANVQAENAVLTERLRELDKEYTVFEENGSDSSGLDRAIEWLVSLGVPGLVLMVAICTSGFAGAAAITSALAALGGPLGMLGGIAVLVLLVPISHTIYKGVTKHGLERLCSRVIHGLEAKGFSRDAIAQKVESYPIPRALKTKIHRLIYAV